MNKTLLIIATMSIGLISSCTSPKEKTNHNQHNQETTIENQKELLKKGMDALFKNHSEEQMRELYTEEYIQHNPKVPSGLDPIIGMLPFLSEAKLDYTAHRVMEDGDLLATHTTYTNAMLFGAPTVVAFDIWRMENGKIAEHWDAIIPEMKETASGRTQTDGATEIVDLDNTEANKELVKNFVEQVLIKEDFSKMDDFIRDGLYDQHNPMVEDGPEALEKVISVSGLKNNKIHRVIGEGNFVLTQSEGVWNGKPQAIYDLFRVADGFIVEHWDVIQEVPKEMAHTNGMF